MPYSQLDHLKKSIDEMTLEDIQTSILVEMANTPVFSREVSEYLLKTYRDRLAELYW